MVYTEDLKSLPLTGLSVRIRPAAFTNLEIVPPPLWGRLGGGMDSALTPLARNLRNNSTDAERFLWQYLRCRQVQGLKFRRQTTIGRYIVDFVCFENKLVIELDGGQHAQEKEHASDYERDEWLRGQGFTVFRFWNNEILENMNGVGETIVRHCTKTPPLAPPTRGGG